MAKIIVLFNTRGIDSLRISDFSKVPRLFNAPNQSNTVFRKGEGGSLKGSWRMGEICIQQSYFQDEMGLMMGVDSH